MGGVDGLRFFARLREQMGARSHVG